MVKVFKEERIEKIYSIFSKNELIKKHILSAEEIMEYSKKIGNNGFLFVACLDCEILGFICGYANDVISKKAFVSFLYIEKSNGFQNAIIVRKLFNECQKYIKEKGMNCIRAEVFDDNEYAQKIYDSIGFIKKEKASDKSHYIELVL